MTYIRRKTPVERSTDKPLGKIIGHMQAFIFWLQKEQDCSTIDTVFVLGYPFSTIETMLINWQKEAYENNYQQVYNGGADEGNKLHEQVFGKFDTVIADYQARINKAKSDLNSLINKTERRITDVTSKLSAAETRIRSAFSKLDALDADMNVAYTELNKHMSNIRDLYDRVKELERQSKSPLLSLIKGT